MNKLKALLREKKNLLTFALIKIINMFTELAATVLIIRKLTVEEYGIYSIALVVIGFVTTFGFSWSSSSILYFGSKEKEISGKMHKTITSRNVIIFLSLIIVTLLFFVFKEYINSYIGEEVALIILGWLYVKVLEDYLVQYFLTIKKQITAALLSLNAKLLFLVSVFLFEFSVEILIYLNIITHSITLFYLIFVNKEDINKFELDYEWFKKVLNFSLWQLFGFSGLYLLNFGDAAVINFYMTKEDVGIYNAAYQLFLGISSFSFIIVSYYASQVSTYFINKNSKAIREFFYKERYLVNIFSLVGHVLAWILVKPLVLTMFGEEFEQAVIVLQILLIGSFFRYYAVFYTLYYNTNEKHKILQIVNIVRAIINVGLSIIFVQWWGIIGVAIGTVLAIIITTLFSYYYCEKRIRLAVKGY